VVWRVRARAPELESESVYALFVQAPVASIALVTILMLWVVTLTLVWQVVKDEGDYP
jgi:hypothetical protein